MVVIPKSGNKEHIKENFDLFSFSLSSEEVRLLNEYHQGVNVYQFTVDGLDKLFRYYYNVSAEEFFRSALVPSN